MKKQKNHESYEMREFLHSWYLLLITFLALLFLLLNRRFILDLPLCLVVFALYFKSGLKFSRFRKIFVYAFLFGFGIFILNILYPAKQLRVGDVYQVLQMTIYKASWDKALATMLRLFLVSLLSMCSASVIDYTKVILHLIVHKGLRPFWGYPMLLAMNSIALFKEEFNRIRINARLRDLPYKDQLTLFFPLLVFAIRHSQRGALSLVTRGLNQRKSFYYSYDLRNQDKKILYLFWLFYFGLVIMSLMTLR